MINSREWIRRYYNALRKTSGPDSDSAPIPLSPMSMAPGSSYQVQEDWGPSTISSPQLPHVAPPSMQRLPTIARQEASSPMSASPARSDDSSGRSGGEEELPAAVQSAEEAEASLLASPPRRFGLAPLSRAETAPIQGYPDVRELDRDFEEQIQDIALISSFEELQGDPWLPKKVSSSADRMPGVPEEEEGGMQEEDSLLLGEEEESVCRPCFPCVDPSRPFPLMSPSLLRAKRVSCARLLSLSGPVPPPTVADMRRWHDQVGAEGLRAHLQDADALLHPDPELVPEVRHQGEPQCVTASPAASDAF